MHFDQAKTFPHPVLREGSNDYDKASPKCGEFEVLLDLRQPAGSTEILITAEFRLSEPTLVELVECEKAQFVVLVECSKTHVRKDLRTFDGVIKINFAEGMLAGEVKLLPFLVASDTILNLQNRKETWNTDYSGRSFDIDRGAVLALDTPHVAWVDTLDEGPIASLFHLTEDQNTSNHNWKIDLNDDRIGILMSKRDRQAFSTIRGRAKANKDWAYLMNGVYLPALIHVLGIADQDSGIFEDFRWYSVIDSRLRKIGSPGLGSKIVGQGRSVDAQKLLGLPFKTLLSRMNEDLDT